MNKRLENRIYAKNFYSGTVISVVAAIFVMQNPFPVYISFWFWQLEANMSLLMIMAILIGAIFSWLLSLSALRQKNRMINEKDLTINQLRKEMNERMKQYNQPVTELIIVGIEKEDYVRTEKIMTE